MIIELNSRGYGRTIRMNNLKPTHIIKDISTEDAWNFAKEHLVGKKAYSIQQNPCYLNGRWISGSFYVLDVDKDFFGRDCNGEGVLYAVFHQVSLESI